MKLEVNGTVYENFKSASVEIALDQLSNYFVFEAVVDVATPFNTNDPCRVLINDIPVLTGYIEIISGSYSAGEHTITIEGRDKTCDLLDSSIAEMDDIRASSLKQIIELVVKNIGADIKVVDESSAADFNKAEDVSAPEPGENAFEFIEKLARKRQVLLTSNGDGDIVITKSIGTPVSTKIQNRKNDNTNNVLSAEFSYDTTGRFNAYKLASAMNPLALNLAGATDLADMVNQSGGAFDEFARTGRQFAIVSEAASSNEENEKRAIWEANIRKARGRLYTATVLGYSNDDGLWDINALVPIVDEFAGINANMLVNRLTFSLDDGGSKTTLRFVESNAYTLALEEPKTEEVASGFSLG